MFKLESEMIPCIHSRLPVILGYPDYLAYANELPVNQRIVDLAAAPIDRERLMSLESMTKVLHRLSMVHLDVLALFVVKSKVSIHYLSEKTFIYPDALHKRFLDVYIRFGLIRQISRYTYSATEWVNALPPYMVAIEAKLSKWQEALRQAVSNKLFADLSFVALSKDNVKISRTVRESFFMEGVGLLVVDHVGEIEEVISPRRTRVRTRDRGLQMIRLLRDLQRKDRKSKWKITDGKE